MSQPISSESAGMSLHQDATYMQQHSFSLRQYQKGTQLQQEVHCHGLHALHAAVVQAYHCTKTPPVGSNTASAWDSHKRYSAAANMLAYQQQLCWPITAVRRHL